MGVNNPMAWGDYSLAVIIVANVLISLLAFFKRDFFDQHVFWVEGIRTRREYGRLFTSGFLHTSVLHLLFNMFALYSFSRMLIPALGVWQFALMYVASLVLSNLFSLAFHRHKPGYRAVGASGAVSAVVYSSVVLFPQAGIGILFIPGSIPAWAFALIFLGISMYGMSRGLGRIGHDAHFAGAILGVIFTVAYYPLALRLRTAVILAILVPAGVFLLVLKLKPHWILRR
jgi:membrane associated rhomboid family serine protease